MTTSRSPDRVAASAAHRRACTASADPSTPTTTNPGGRALLRMAFIAASPRACRGPSTNDICRGTRDTFQPDPSRRGWRGVEAPALQDVRPAGAVQQGAGAGSAGSTTATGVTAGVPHAGASRSGGTGVRRGRYRCLLRRPGAAAHALSYAFRRVWHTRAGGGRRAAGRAPARQTLAHDEGSAPLSPGERSCCCPAARTCGCSCRRGASDAAWSTFCCAPITTGCPAGPSSTSVPSPSTGTAGW